MRATNENILSVLDVVIKPGQETDWSDIVAAVSNKMTIKNWLQVRGVLQYMINHGIVKRTNSVHVEHYIRLK